MQGVPSNEGAGFYNTLNIINKIERIASQNSKQQETQKITSFFAFAKLFVKGFSKWSDLDKRYFIDSLIILHRRSIAMNGKDICFKMLNIIRSMQKDDIKIPDFLSNNDNRNKASSNVSPDKNNNEHRSKLEKNKDRFISSGLYVSLLLFFVVLFCSFLLYKYSGVSVAENQFKSSVVENKTNSSLNETDSIVTGASRDVAAKKVQEGISKVPEAVVNFVDSVKNNNAEAVVSAEINDIQHPIVTQVEDPSVTEKVEDPASTEQVEDPSVTDVDTQNVDNAAPEDPLPEDPLIAEYEKLAEANNPTAAFALGHQYEQQNTPEANASARYWYERAAQGGNVAAMYNLGVLLLKDSDHSNWIEGVLWLRKAANYGLVPAQYNLGLALSEGVGAKKDLEEAFIWFSLASLKQDPDSIKMRDNLLEGLDTSQRERAQALLSIWRPQVVDEKANESVETLLPQQQE